QNVVSRCAIFRMLLRDPRVHIRVGHLSQTRQTPCDLYSVMKVRYKTDYAALCQRCPAITPALRDRCPCRVSAREGGKLQRSVQSYSRDFRPAAAEADWVSAADSEWGFDDSGSRAGFPASPCGFLRRLLPFCPWTL